MRYLAHTPETRQEMMEAIGITSIDELFLDIPEKARSPQSESGLLDLPLHMSELDVEEAFRNMAACTRKAGDGPFFLGGGHYHHHIPASVDALIQRGEFLTSYTPYQPEISQGTLQYLYEFQTQVARLFGMEIANASLYDGATATVEAIMMANRVTGRKQALISGGLHPHYRETVETYAKFTDFHVTCLSPTLDTYQDMEQLYNEIEKLSYSCVVIQYPNFFGELTDVKKLAALCQEKGILLVMVVTEVVALGLVPSPGEMGADIVVGEGQSLGVGLNGGGPTVGLFATKQKFLRQIPGRIVGETSDLDGQRGWVLTLCTREQHIRREKATSNICTNSGLCALAFTIHLTLLGEVGLKRLARLNHAKMIRCVEKLKMIPDITIMNKSFFNEIVIALPYAAKKIVNRCVSEGILAGIPLSRFYGDDFSPYLLVTVTEMTSDKDMDRLVFALSSCTQGVQS